MDTGPSQIMQMKGRDNQRSPPGVKWYHPTDT